MAGGERLPLRLSNSQRLKRRLIHPHDQFPIGMGTGAVYTILSGFEHRSPVLVGVETGFYFLNMFLFILNSSTLLLQAICEHTPPESF